MGKVIYPLFFFLLTGIFFYLKEKTPLPRPPDYPPGPVTSISDPPPPITIEHIRIMQNMGVRVQFPSERKSHLLSATTLPRDLLQVELLKLSGSSLHRVPPWLKRLTNLRCLDLSENNLDADDLLETLQAMPKLDVLNLSKNPLFKSGSSQDISLAPVWQVLNSLGELYLSDTQGTVNNYGSLAKLRALQKLDLSHNRIGDDIAVLKLNKLHVLYTLNLSHNRITQFPGRYLPMSQLQNLDVSHNNLTKIFYVQMPQIETFYLHRNGLISMKDNYGDPFSLSNLRKLSYDSGSKIPQKLRDRFDTVQEHSGIMTAELVAHDEWVQPLYIIHGNGTVTDSSTGLMWKRCPEGLFGVHCGNGNVNTYTWEDAKKHFIYDSSYIYAGYSDWRIPTIRELKTLRYCSKGAGGNNTCGCREGSRRPTINIQVFPNTPLSQCWSASYYSTSYTRGAWGVYFNDGCAAGYALNDRYTVRLVRNTNSR